MLTDYILKRSQRIEIRCRFQRCVLKLNLHTGGIILYVYKIDLMNDLNKIISDSIS